MKRQIEHKIQLETSTKIILLALAIGVLANAFSPAFSIKSAFSELAGNNFVIKHIITGNINDDFNYNPIQVKLR